MDKITIKNMKIYGYHGVFPKEQVRGQNFLVDVEMMTDVSKAGNSDELEDTVDYSKTFGMVKNIVENNRFKLIEKLAQCISDEVLAGFEKVCEVTVRVKKPDAPIDGDFDYVEVEIKRTRDEK